MGRLTEKFQSRKRSWTTIIFRFAIRLIVSTSIFCLVIFLIQDFLIFPVAQTGWFGKSVRTAKLPAGVTSHLVTTSDNEKIEVWHFKPVLVRSDLPVVIMFHGNGGTVDGFFGYQRWLGSLGMQSYSFDYRGYGQSTGWPSEEGLYRDADAVWELVQRDQKINGSQVLVFGISIGSGPAAYLASKINSATVMLLAGYSSLVDLVREKPIYRYLAWMLRYELPTSQYLQRLNSSCVILSHGKKDSIIPYSNFERIFESLRGHGRTVPVVSEVAGHNDLFNHVHRDLEQAIASCLKRH